MRQTAVEWLAENIDNLIPFMNNDIAKKFSELVQQSKEMEKQQIIDANNRGYSVGRKDIYETAEEYYNQTFKNK